MSQVAPTNEDFAKAAADLKALAIKPKDEDLLSLYALYKQATEGDNKTPKPSIVDFRQKAKHGAWLALKGTPREEAMTRYVNQVRVLLEACNKK